MSLYAVGVDLGTMQNAGAVPTRVSKTVTFTGAAGAGAVGTVALFTVTGDVQVTGLWIKCTTDMTEAGSSATIGTGVTGATGYFYGGMGIGQGARWFNGDGSWTTAAGGNLINDGSDHEGAASISANILFTITDQNVTGGVVTVYVNYIPLSAGASVVAA